jgi:hypothetical protein
VTAAVRALLAATALAVAAALLAGCGDDPTPADAVPSLARDLEQVDEAFVARDFDQAAAALDDIEATTEAALLDGTLSDADGDRILAAVTALRDALPEEQPTAPKSSPTEEPPTSPPDEDEGDDEDEGEEDENGENGEGKEDKENGKGKG